VSSVCNDQAKKLTGASGTPRYFQYVIIIIDTIQ